MAGSIVVPASAQAASGFTVDFRLPVNRGVHVYFQATGGSFDGALFSAFRNERSGGTSTTYFKTRVGRGIGQDEIDLDFGRRGHVQTEFIETGRNRLHVRGCEGYVLARRGIFAGSMRFRGESGYAVTRARRTRGHVFVDHVKNCHSGGGVRASKETRVTACPGDGLMYGALVNRQFDSAVHFASEFEEQPGLIVSRDAVWFGRARSFEVSHGGEEAALRPGEPFKGSARVEDGHLAGDLRVRFLGHRRPRELTPARAKLERSRDGVFGCSDRVDGHGRASAAELLGSVVGPPSPADLLDFTAPEHFGRLLGR